MSNNSFEPKIVWEKWVDPFGEDIDEVKWNDYEDEDNEIYEQSEQLKNHLKKPVKVIASPLGLIPYNEYTASGKIFNFWIGHTNFNISQELVNCLEEIDGIEILDVFTRYRFRIAIGKCFTDHGVMNNIKESIYSFFNIPIFYDE